jgi:hypothetical protein
MRILSGANLSAPLRSGDIEYLSAPGTRLMGTNLDRANLSNANLSGAKLVNSTLRDADLTLAKLHGSVLNFADLTGENLSRADLTRAGLLGTNLSKARLNNASLVRAELLAAILNDTSLDGAILTDAELSEAVLADLDLTKVVDLETCHHFGPSFVDYQTLRRSNPLPTRFLRGVGLADALIDHLPSLLNQAIQYYSCFISYSTKDQEFADRLYADLQSKGVRCWFAPH